jgi:hypothetical protein
MEKPMLALVSVLILLGLYYSVQDLAARDFVPAFIGLSGTLILLLIAVVLNSPKRL